MSYTALVIGSTGLIGTELCQQLLTSEQYSQVIIINRRPSGLSDKKLTERVIDFSDLEDVGGLPKIDHAFCCLGTTMKKAGSKEAFYRVDFDYVYSFGKLAKSLGCHTFVLVSAMGADAHSSVFYNRVKGEAEEAIGKLGFKSSHFVRPSLLLGDRDENRLGESLGKLFAQTFKILIPKNYQAVEAKDVASFMKQAALKKQLGQYTHLSGELQGSSAS